MAEPISLFQRMATQANLMNNALEPQLSASHIMKDSVSQQLVDYDGDEKNRNLLEDLRDSAKHFLENTLAGFMWSQMMMFLSVLSLVQYVYLTYIENNQDKNWHLYDFFFFLELAIACAFVFDWMVSFLASEQKFYFMVSFNSMVDIMTVIPVFATFNVTCPDYGNISTGLDAVYYVLCGLTTTRILRSLRFRKSFYRIDDDVHRYLADMSLKIVVMILFNSAVMQYFEPDQKLDFHTWNYFLLVTITTVGYGDISPDTVLGRFFAMGMIIVAIIFVPQWTNELMEKINRQSVFARANYEPKSSNSSHVLVCGDLRSSSLEEFFSELFHEDHDIRNLYAVILQPEAPSYEILQILEDKEFSQSVEYLEGNALNEKDLKRAKASRATAIFIMTNKFSINPDEEDAKTILQQFSIQRYLRLHSDDRKGGSGSHDSLFCLQLIRPENKRHLVTSADHTSTDLVICLNEIKMGVIAKAVMFPGANTLIMNLLTSFADDKDFGSLAKQHQQHDIETLDDDEDSDWLGEYQRGCDWEIYTTELSTAFEGTSFASLSEVLYQKIGIVLFALEIEDLKKDTRRLLLNPADYVIPAKGDGFKVEAFVIAKNKAQSDLTFAKGNHDSILGSGINFSHLSVLATGLAQRMSVNQSNRVHVAGFGGTGFSDLTGEERQEFREKQAWQILLHRHESAEITSESRQEETQKLEDKMLRENYFIRDTHMDVGDAIIRTSVSEEMPFVDSHIIIIGKALSNLYDLIRPLRAKHMGDLKHIIIVYPGDFPPAVWQRIRIFESVWIIRGSALEEADIRRAGIFKAKQVVVLADNSSAVSGETAVTSGSAAGLDALVDADAIFCYQCVRKMNEQAHVVVEIVRHTNVGYLDPESGLNSSDIDYKFTPQFASGALFATSLLDTLVCQAFYNTKIIDVINRLIGSVETVDGVGSGTKPGSCRPSPTKPGNGSLNRTGAGLSSGSSYLNMASSSLYQIGIPDGLESRTYGALYRLLSRRKQIPLGILRGVFSHTKSGPKSNKMPYVFTNPPKDTELFTCDKVFVLSQTPVGVNKYSKDDSKEMHMYSNLRSRKKTAEDIIMMVGDLREEVRRVQSHHHDMDHQLTALRDDVNNKFDTLFRALNVHHVSTSSGGGGGQGGDSHDHRPFGSPSRRNSGTTPGASSPLSRSKSGKMRGMSFESGNELRVGEWY